MDNTEDRNSPITKADLAELRGLIEDRFDRLEERINFGVHLLGYLHERRYNDEVTINPKADAIIEVDVLNKTIYALGMLEQGDGIGMYEDILEPSFKHRSPHWFPGAAPRQKKASPEGEPND